MSSAPPTTLTGAQLCTQGDVELALGGADVLVQLVDKDGDGAADAALVAFVIASASADAVAAVGTQYTPALRPPYPDVLVLATARLAGFYAWAFGTKNQAVTEVATRLKDMATDTFDKISKRLLSLGVTVDPATNQAVSEIDRDPNHDQTTRGSTRGSLW